MNINYYKQPQSNDFILFTKRPGRIRRIIVVALLAVFLASAFGIWKLKHRGKHTQVATEAVPTTIVADSTSFTVDTLNTTLTDSYYEKVLAIQSPAKAKYTAANDGHSKTITIKSRDTLGKIFSRLDISKKELHAILESGKDAALLKKLTPGKELLLTLDDEHHVKQLSYAANLTDTVNVLRKGDSFSCQLQTKPLENKQSIAKFTVHGSVIASGKKAGLSDKQLAQLTSIFKSSVDMNKGKHEGDNVSVLYQDYYLNNNKVRDGEIVAAEYKTATNTYQAVRFTDPKGNSGYYAPDGSSMQKRFLAAPLKFTRISSLFNPKRWHPVLHRFRHHQGVDYAAPYGTPIKSVASGVIALKGRKGGYGNTIIIKHDSSYSTLYGHLSKYSQTIKVGSHVQQGQVIGYVGASGLATGPHLHFEFRINGVNKNPLTVALPNGKSITRAYRNKFHLLAKKLLAKLDRHKHVDS